MITTEQKIALLRRVVDLLNEADALQQQALGDCDVCWDNHEQIQDIADDIVVDIIDLEQPSNLEKLAFQLLCDSAYIDDTYQVWKQQRLIDQKPVLWGVRDAGGKFSPYAHWTKKDAERIASASHAGAVAAPLYANPPQDSQ